MRVLICGGREYNDWQRFNGLLDRIHAQNGIACIIQGGATGADWLARAWSDNNAVLCETYAADWKTIDTAEPCKVKYNDRGEAYNAFAGFNRNQRMITEGKPDLVIAFPGGTGTLDMCNRAVAATIPTMRVNPPIVEDSQGVFCHYDEEGNEIATPKPVEWLLPPDPTKPRKPRRAAPTPADRYEAEW